MVYVGIDIAKLNHFAAAISSDGTILVEPFGFANNYDGYDKLLSSLKEFDKNDIIIGLESTAHYGNNLMMFLVEKQFNVCVINPIRTATMRRNNIRRTKTDMVDSIVVAKTLMMNPSRFCTMQDIALIQLKNLGRFRHRVSKQRTRNKIQLVSYVDQIFPELQFYFNGIDHKGVYAVLKEAPSPQLIASMDIDHLAHILKVNSRGHFNEKTAKGLKDVASKSIGHGDSSLSIQITQTIAHIELLDSHIKALEAEIVKLLQPLNSVIMTLPGMGYVQAATILGEIGDINRFSSPHKLVAYSGLDPSIYQSGNFNATHTRMSKRGSRTLRYALIYAAHNAVKYNTTFRKYYDSKRSEGRGHYNALGHCAGKLTRIIYKMLKDGVEFNLE